jgi:hypothetical protein
MSSNIGQRLRATHVSESLFYFQENFNFSCCRELAENRPFARLIDKPNKLTPQHIVPLVRLLCAKRLSDVACLLEK